MSDDAFSFRPLTRDDFPMLCDWLNRPHVAEWWQGPMPLARVEEELGADLASPFIHPHIARLDGTPIGFIQYYIVKGADPDWWQDETDPGARGIDQFLADGSRLSQGLGSRMVAAFVAKLFADPAVTKVQTDPSPDNARAIRAYEKVGFRPVRRVATPDGEALLMVITRAEHEAKGL